MKVVGFDLDDTLYSHWDYEQILYKKIAELTADKFEFDEILIFAEMQKLFDKKAFDKLFDNAIINAGYALPTGWDDFVVSIILPFYRNHKPANVLTVYDWALPLFKKLRENGLKLVLITNGGETIQKNKIGMLNLPDEFDKVYISDEFNPPLRKPDTKIFQMVLDDFNISADEMIYVGDSPEKDAACENIGIKFILNTEYKKLFEILDIRQ